jgi:preprotein translocase subunit SecA
MSMSMNTTRAELPIPGLLWGDYPERRPTPRRLAERLGAALRGDADRLSDAAAALLRWRDARCLAQVHAAQAALAASVTQDDAAALQAVRTALLRHGLTPPALAPAFALAARAAHRCLGVQPFDTQLIAAHAVLGKRLAEMATGEGKTLAVALAAAVGALAGMPVHVVTANDYLVARDAQRLQAMYAALGLSVGWVVQSDAPTVRAQAYACDITYVTAKELVFDYLRDSLGAGSAEPGAAPRRRRDALAAPLARLHAAPEAPALLRGLCMAIVDEADAILIDEARVPLILSQRTDAAPAQGHAKHALRFARTLREGADFQLDAAALAATLTEHGRDRLDRAAASLANACASPAWRNRLHREHAVGSALAALHLYQRDRHYLVRDAGVQIIDETTGRVAEGRIWSNGLQQLIEAKEGCEPSPGVATLAQLTYQRFFPRYVRLGGLSGTLLDARAELMATYGVSLRRVPLRLACRRSVGPTRLFATHDALWAAVTERVAQLHRSARPVLVATDSVADAQALALRLAACGLPHAVLHARNDHDEASVVAQAGQRGAITVTTNMSGRGTDIELGRGVKALGGLHVICCQLNSARRIDRQLAGRAARQGDPGSVETLLSLDNALLARALPAPVRAGLRRVAHVLPSWAVRALARAPQWAEEHSQRVQRRRLIEHDERSARQLGFGGPAE